MRSIIIGLSILITLSSCQFSEEKVPEKVIRNFKNRFPNAKDVKWEKEKKTYEAEFTVNGTEVSLVYDKKGDLLETETEITSNQLPVVILNSITKEFPGYRIEEIDKIESNQPLIYEIEIQKHNDAKEVYFDSEGKILKVKEED